MRTESIKLYLSTAKYHDLMIAALRDGCPIEARFWERRYDLSKQQWQNHWRNMQRFAQVLPRDRQAVSA